MKKNINIALGLLLMFCVSSCDLEDFGNKNIDPAQISADKASVDLILPAAQEQTAFSIGALPGRLPGLIMQHFAGNEAQQVSYENYNIDENVMNNYWRFGAYAGAMKDAKDIMDRSAADAGDLPHYSAIAKILMAQNLGMLSSMFGDVPYSEAFQLGDNFKPVFDTQSSIYSSIQTLLDEAIVEAQQATTNRVPGTDDLIFNGDMSMWVKTAYALKARYYMHLSKRDGVAAANNALTALTNAISDNGDNPNFGYTSNVTFSNPYSQFGKQRIETMIMNPTFINMLQSKNDPRETLFIFDNGNGQFLHVGTGMFWTQDNSALPLISYTEVKFIEAEALVMQGDLAGAETALAEAITANMEQVGASGFATYVTDNSGISGLTDAQALEKVISEKYIALYAQGELEVWTDYRRTGYPNLTPVASNGAGLNPSMVVPRRLIYPISERTTNEANLTDAVGRAANGGGTNLLDTPTELY